MSSIYPRGKKGIYQYVNEAHGIKKSMKTNNPTIAAALQAKWDSKLLRSENGLTDYDKTWSEYRQEFSETYLAEHSAASLVKLNVILTHFERIVRPVKLMGIKESHCKLYRAVRLEGGILPQTVDCEEKYLKPFFSSAMRNGYIEKDPYANIRRLEFQTPESESMSYEGAQSFIALMAEKYPEYALLGQFLYDTGMRLREVAWQRMEDINFQRGVMKVSIHSKLCDCLQCVTELKVNGVAGWKPKRGKERFVPLTPRLQTELLRLFQERPRGNVFLMRWRTIQHVVQKVHRMKDKTLKLNVHTFRHTLSNELRLAGVDEQVRKAWLGHGKSSVHETYQHVKEAELLGAVVKLQAWRDEQRTKIKKTEMNGLTVLEEMA